MATATKLGRCAASASETVYQQVKALAGPIVKHYRDDLVKHDRRTFQDDPTRPFLHFSRECGTHLITLDSAESYPLPGDNVPFLFGTAQRDKILADVVGSVRHIANYETTELILHWDGRRLWQVTVQESIDVAEVYSRKIRNEWQAGNVADETVVDCPCFHW